MVVIVTESIDQPTSTVMSWISHFGYKSIRVNFIDFLRENDISIFLSNKEVDFFFIKEKKISFKEIKGVWFRRVPKIKLYSDFMYKVPFSEEKLKFAKDVWEFIVNEDKDISYYFNNKLSQVKNTIGNPFVTNLNKIEQLERASDFDLSIPKTLISSNKKEIINFLNKNDSIIKPISNIKSFNLEGKFFTSFTRSIYADDIQGKEMIFPAIIQEKIDKAYEVRVFVLDNKTYSMAIFDSGNNTDYREIKNTIKINTSKYRINKDLESKILKLTKSYGINCCSVDLIKDKKGKYYFLEINPVGQFGFVSYPCNYNLEKIIAKKLCQI